MEERQVYLSTNTACSSGDLSTSVMAIYNDPKRAVSTIRISLASMTTNDEINKFLMYFDEAYNRLNSMNN